jgi:hypothetical protein
MKVLFPVLVLCTVAVVAVVLAIHFRVKRHLREQTHIAPAPESDQEQRPGELPTGVEEEKENHSS